MNNFNIDENMINNLKKKLDNGELSDVISKIPPEFIQNFSSAVNNTSNMNKSNTNNSQGYFKRYTSVIKSLIHDETHKSSEERSRDLKALILTIIIVAFLIFIAWKVPFLHNLIFP